MKPPCRNCQFEFNSKISRFIWIKGMEPNTPRNENRTAIHVPGCNYPNPCYDCPQAKTYDDHINQLYDLPPVTGSCWPQGDLRQPQENPHKRNDDVIDYE